MHPKKLIHFIVKFPMKCISFFGYAPKEANTFHWKLYDAILKDIKENIDQLLEKE